MFFDNYPIKLSESTKPYFLKGLKTAPVILLIHGYTGSSYDMIWLGRQLNEVGYSVYIPRLPGHGTNKYDFLDSTWRDWLRAVCDAYIDLAVDYEKVYVGGLSMGGILTALVAAKFQPEKIFLCAPAFIATNYKIKYTPFLKYFIKSIPCGKKNCGNDQEYARAIADYSGTEYLSKSADLYHLQKMAIKYLPTIRSQTLTILSKTDKSVPFKVKDLITKNLHTQNEFFILEESSHIVVNDIAKEYVAQKIIEFLKN